MKLLETLGIPVSPFRTIRTRDRRKYRRKVEVRRCTVHSVIRIPRVYGGTLPSSSLSISPPPLPSLPFQTIRFIRKSCTRNGRSRERENTCAHVCMGTKSMEVFEDAVPPPLLRNVSSNRRAKIPIYATVYIFHVLFYEIGQKRELESFSIGLEKNFEGKFRIRGWIG